MNCKDEFLGHINGEVKKDVLCVKIEYKPYFNKKSWDVFILSLKYTLSDYTEFLRSIDFDYKSGFGPQELFGTIWYTDETWSSRGEYDGSEWWDYNTAPIITKDLI